MSRWQQLGATAWDVLRKDSWRFAKAAAFFYYVHEHVVELAYVSFPPENE